MRDYKGWTAKERLASLKKTKAAIAAGIIPPPTKCNRCGKTAGRIDYHNHDYSDPVTYLEQLCQGCHTRLHSLENKELDCKSNEIMASKVNIITPKNADSKNMSEKSMIHTAVGMRDEMHRIRVEFTKALGLDWSENPSPNSGYKYENNLNRRQKFLDEARELRKKYAELVAISGKGKSILEKMDSNLANRDLRATWK